MEIKNREQIVDELTEMIRNFDKERNPYQTDVYLYLDEDGNGTLYEFTNVGGNSWLEDEHYVIYVDKQHYEDVFDGYPDINSMALTIGIDVNELIHDAAVYLEIDEDDVNYSDVREYIKNNDSLMEKIEEGYNEDVDANDYYDEIAETYMTELEKEIKFREDFGDDYI